MGPSSKVMATTRSWFSPVLSAGCISHGASPQAELLDNALARLSHFYD